MGGGHALTIALQHCDIFSQIGAFSSAPPKEDLITDAGKENAKLNKNLKVFWVACGDKDFLYERNQKMNADFKQMKINHDYNITLGDGHAWPVWRRYLAEFATKLFK